MNILEELSIKNITSLLQNNFIKLLCSLVFGLFLSFIVIIITPAKYNGELVLINNASNQKKFDELAFIIKKIYYSMPYDFIPSNGCNIDIDFLKKNGGLSFKSDQSIITITLSDTKRDYLIVCFDEFNNFFTNQINDHLSKNNAHHITDKAIIYELAKLKGINSYDFYQSIKLLLKLENQEVLSLSNFKIIIKVNDIIDNNIRTIFRTTSIVLILFLVYLFTMNFFYVKINNRNN
jgi:hypothetical protein